jgi:xanthine dehydrogenase accessory factor
LTEAAASVDSIYRQAKEFLDRGETVAIATIVSTRGSTPREAGAKMVVTAWGQILGTIGGGCGEADVRREAIDVIRTGKPKMVQVDLLDDIASDSPAVCGGIMNVFIEPWSKKTGEG